MGTTTTAVLLVLTGSAAVLALAGCARRGVRQWVCHGAGALAMAAMLLPAADPLGRVAWVALLAGTAAWTTVAVVRARLTGGDPADDAAGAREVAEAWLMCVLALLMSGHGVPSAADPTAHHGTAGAPAVLPAAALAGLVGVWAVAVATAHRSGPHGASPTGRAAVPLPPTARAWRSHASTAGSVLAVAAMVGMAGAAALG